jgi:hypothetical protein
MFRGAGKGERRKEKERAIKLTRENLVQERV